MVGHPFFNQSKHFFFFLFELKTNPLRGGCRHQIKGVRGVKREVDVSRVD
ncbi:hypothetical protein Hanom_Chr06g00569101 [Helianthus anomalus]